MKISQMKNLGKVTESQLNQVGIKDSEDLIRVGTEAAFLQIRDQVDDGACINLLMGLEGAVQDIPKQAISLERKESLKQFYQSL